MDEIADIRDALGRLHAAVDDLVVRGTRAAGPREIARLEGLRDEMRTAGAGHIAGRLDVVATALRNDDRAAAPALLRLMAAIRLFDRMLTLEVASGMLAAAVAAGGEPEEDPGP